MLTAGHTAFFCTYFQLELDLFMRMSLIRFLTIVLVAAPPLAAPGYAQPRDPAATVQQLAGLNADMVNIATLLRISEDLAFWQSVSILGAEHGWDFDYSLGGAERYPWTLRLYNALDETLTEGLSASRDLARSRALSDDEKRAVQSMFAKYEQMRALAAAVYQLILDGDLAAATALYEAEVIQLRRNIATDGASIHITIRNRVRQIAMDVRLGN